MLQGRHCRRLAVLAVATAGTTLLPAAGAEAATITACVKKSTGEMRLRSGAAAKKKCRRGWKKVTWSTTGRTGSPGRPGIQGLPGAAGPAGPAGPLTQVRAANGATVGALLGVVPQSVTIYSILRDGGIYLYLGSGHVYPLGTPSFKANDCSGTPYMKNTSSSLPGATFAAFIAGPWRLTFRTLGAGVFGATQAWRSSGATETIPATQLYRFDSETGACEADGGAFTGDIVALTPVAAPPDLPGPLTFG